MGQKRKSKLVLWQTSCSKRILTHDELLPIMENLGFVALPINPRKKMTAFDGIEIPWTEFKYRDASANNRAEPLRSKSRPIRIDNNDKPPPNPRLPRDYIDGLHLYTYMAFLNAVNSYFGFLHGAGPFHIQGIPVDLDETEMKNWVNVEYFGIAVRRGTLDPNDELTYGREVLNFSDQQMLSAKEQDDDPEIVNMVPMDSIIVVNKSEKQ